MKLHNIARALFGGFFIYSGINHFIHEKELARCAKAKHIPAPDAAVIASGVALVAGGTSLALGLKPKVGAAPIVGFPAAVSPPSTLSGATEIPTNANRTWPTLLKTSL